MNRDDDDIASAISVRICIGLMMALWKAGGKMIICGLE
jgi:hypothetical protein